MPEKKFEGTGRFRIKLPRKLWEKIKALAPWKSKSPSELVEDALEEYLDNHNAIVKMNGENIIVEEVD